MYHTLPNNELQKIWVKILNPKSNVVAPYSQMFDFFERFARGSMQESPTLISKTFAAQMLDLFEKEGCLPTRDKVDMKILASRISDGTFEIHLFN